jgi:hypothetical protein
VHLHVKNTAINTKGFQFNLILAVYVIGNEQNASKTEENRDWFRLVMTYSGRFVIGNALQAVARGSGTMLQTEK